ncbi:FAD binding domain-containing protein [Nannizzia gypsea CBS 118893]|uniref:FAD binding domain-containing protein n=1 Tax=Arthroderma gypseum (strain ATCC MYA-4604 / CBS 118893) TaxID=535722 RepID=E4V758_ARTGP|nr:FAD binding domain-containing protein [Nannizzia gypsea CBS 118893]EFQ96924.1 FAD binding domain-containing protein [Nannizzia gypsea CBS 118893]
MASMNVNTMKEELISRLSKSSAVTVEADASWEEALKRWTRYRGQTPAAVVHPANEEDVIKTISYAVQHQRPFVVRGGGHSNGFSTISSPGIVLDLSRMRHASVDVERAVAVVQGGATMGDGVRVAASAGLAIATGTCNEVGLVGASLGGGIGRLLGLYGYAADTIVSMRVAVVESSGRPRIVEASREANPDLFWALRGSGHLFGVVVQATFRAFPWAYETWHSCLVFQPCDAAQVAETIDLVNYQGGMQGRLVFCAPNNQPLVLLQLWYMGDPGEAAAKFQPLLELPSMAEHPLHVIGRLIPYANLNDSSDRICAYAGRKNLAAFGMQSISGASCTAALRVYTDFITRNPAAGKTHILTEFYSMDVAQELDRDGKETSIPQQMRKGVKYWVMPLAWYEDAALDDACAGLNKAIREAFLTHADGSRAASVGYVNMPFEEDTASSIFGDEERLQVLRHLKQKWDPLGAVQGVVQLQ